MRVHVMLPWLADLCPERGSAASVWHHTHSVSVNITSCSPPSVHLHMSAVTVAKNHQKLHLQNILHWLVNSRTVEFKKIDNCLFTLIHVDSQYIPLREWLHHGADPLLERFEEMIGWLTVVCSPYDDLDLASVLCALCRWSTCLSPLNSCRMVALIGQNPGLRVSNKHTIMHKLHMLSRSWCYLTKGIDEAYWVPVSCKSALYIVLEFRWEMHPVLDTKLKTNQANNALPNNAIYNAKANAN